MRCEVLRILRLLVPAFVLLSGNVSQAMSMREAVELAITNNPAVLASFNAYVASGDGLKAARGGYLPRLDFDAELGSERIENQQSIESSLSAESYRLTLTQMLFDGFATREGVEKERYTQLTRYYEFRQVSEDVALETVQAYLDILRYRHLLAIAKENYLKHLRYHTDIESRVKTGFGRGVDLDQASARLALAESNVLTETTNLHDVSARFLRLVGRVPPALLEDPVIPASRIPDDLQKVLLHTNAKNPSLNAAIETIRSARAEFRGRKAPMMPRFDLRLRKQLDDNVGGIEGNYDEEAIELVMAYNLYNGGSDRARKRQAKYLMFEAEDNRDRVCREVRQTVTIAYNDISSTAQLISFLERNEESISRARKAYEKQFDIGQRTLLDLLDSENEYFDARRSLLNARADIRLAQVQTLAGMGELLHASKLKAETPTSRSFSTALATISGGWMRLIAFCTVGSNSCTPKLARVKPWAPIISAISSVSVRGSPSIAISALGRISKRSRSLSMITARSSGASAVGVPPPKWVWLTIRRSGKASAIRSISLISVLA